MNNQLRSILKEEKAHFRDCIIGNSKGEAEYHAEDSNGSKAKEGKRKGSKKNKKGIKKIANTKC